MTDLLEDLDEQEIRGLVEALRSGDSKTSIVPWSLMTDAEIVAEVLRRGAPLYALATRCTARKVLVRVMERDGSLLKYVPWHLRDLDVCQAAAKESGWVLGCSPGPGMMDLDGFMSHVPGHFQASIRKELGIERRAGP